MTFLLKSISLNRVQLPSVLSFFKFINGWNKSNIGIASPLFIILYVGNYFAKKINAHMVPYFKMGTRESNFYVFGKLCPSSSQTSLSGQVKVPVLYRSWVWVIAPTQQLTIICNSSSRDSNALFWLPNATDCDTYAYMKEKKLVYI